MRNLLLAGVVALSACGGASTASAPGALPNGLSGASHARQATVTDPPTIRVIKRKSPMLRYNLVSNCYPTPYTPIRKAFKHTGPDGITLTATSDTSCLSLDGNYINIKVLDHSGNGCAFLIQGGESITYTPTPYGDYTCTQSARHDGTPVLASTWNG